MRRLFFFPMFARPARKRAVAGAVLLTAGALAAGVWLSSVWLFPRVSVGRLRVGVRSGVVWLLTLPELPAAPAVVVRRASVAPSDDPDNIRVEFDPHPRQMQSMRVLMERERVRRVEQLWARMAELRSSAEQKELANNIRFIAPDSMREFRVWPVEAAPAVAGLLLLWWAASKRRAAAGVSCSYCGYSLAGLAAGAVCPECGHAVVAHAGVSGCSALPSQSRG